MACYRKKPVVIDAERFDGTEASARAIVTWARGHGIHIEERVRGRESHTYLRIPTLEGAMTASPGDYIILGLKGEMYPCTPEIFALTYEEVPRG